ncbi:thermonuclease family protein [Caldibacillus thermoamylovorans]|uniref:thermonuclease family protein n=1 Tax=Caldibacillus thermoamylovorans TaxID=35841 RepID=UPI001D07577F|nr:thermonuclease family protein [Caldibacillus thermoamylovorans]MCB5933858.1 thermonuclease family protein [Bacillus sp. DFI.2.34]MCB7077136.1 thermonuclease family protein [Caldibacillus thermoamylovorans]
MKKIILVFLTFFLLAGCAGENTSRDSTTKPDQNSDIETTVIEEDQQNPSQEAPESAENDSVDNSQVNGLNGKVMNVVDGDTMDIQFENGKEERVRLVLVDTPETKHPTKPVQPFGPEASAFTKEMLAGKNVQVELDVQERDQYGRILAYVYIDGKMFNELLLEKGLARVAVFPPNTRYVDEFYAIQKKAQEAKLGIWSIEDYVTDNGYIVQEETGENQSSTNTNIDCQNPIKGNINSKGEKIYHVPGGQYYDITKAEELFCTEQEAVNAGYRKSQR